MNIDEIATKADLEKAKAEILAAVCNAGNNAGNDRKKFLRSSEVKAWLGISDSGLQNLRIQGTLPFSKMGGIHFYAEQDILDLLEASRNKAA